jgi:hypothetical protein
MIRYLALVFLLLISSSVAQVTQAPDSPWPGQCPAGTLATAVGCQPQAGAVGPDDLVLGWQVGQQPSTRSLKVDQITKEVLKHVPIQPIPPPGTPENPVNGWFKSLNISDALGHFATVRLEFATFADFAAYKPSVYTTAAAWAGATVVAHTAGYYKVGDYGGATYIYDKTSSAGIDGLFFITPGGGSPGRWILEPSATGVNVTQLGVPTDGITSADVKMKAAVDACANYGIRLNLPFGKILLNGAATIHLRDCHLIGVGVMAGAATGSMFIMTSTSVKPFTIGDNWGISGVNFYWPNQTDGKTFYPPLFSPVGGEQDTTVGWYLDHVVIVNAYDAIVTGGGRFLVSNSFIYAVHDAFRVGNIGDSFIVNAVHFTPGPWFTMTNNAAAAAIGEVTNSNTMFHAVGVVNMSVTGVASFAWRYGLKIEPAGVVGITELDWSLDKVGTVLDAGTGGAYSSQNVAMRGASNCSHADMVTPANIGHEPCFNLGANAHLVLNGWVAEAAGNFIQTAGANVIIDRVLAHVGNAKDAGDYYGVLATANPSGGAHIGVQNSSFSGQFNAKTHGIKTTVQVTRFLLRDSAFQGLNDVIDIPAAPTTFITGNWSIDTFGPKAINDVNMTSSGNGVQYNNNQFDKAPVAIPSGCGTNCTVPIGAFSGFIQIGTGGAITKGALKVPWPVFGFGYLCRFYSNGTDGVIVQAVAVGNTWNWTTNGVDMSGRQIYFVCTGAN